MSLTYTREINVKMQIEVKFKYVQTFKFKSILQ